MHVLLFHSPHLTPGTGSLPHQKSSSPMPASTWRDPCPQEIESIRYIYMRSKGNTPNVVIEQNLWSQADRLEHV